MCRVSRQGFDSPRIHHTWESKFVKWGASNDCEYRSSRGANPTFPTYGSAASPVRKIKVGAVKSYGARIHNFETTNSTKRFEVSNVLPLSMVKQYSSLRPE